MTRGVQSLYDHVAESKSNKDYPRLANAQYRILQTKTTTTTATTTKTKHILTTIARTASACVGKIK